MSAVQPYQPPSREQRELGEAFEAACSKASRLYDEGKDTTAADAEVDRLLDELRAKGWA